MDRGLGVEVSEKTTKLLKKGLNKFSPPKFALREVPSTFQLVRVVTRKARLKLYISDRRTKIGDGKGRDVSDICEGPTSEL